MAPTQLLVAQEITGRKEKTKPCTYQLCGIWPPVDVQDKQSSVAKPIIIRPFVERLEFLGSNVYVVVIVAVGMWESRSDFQERWERAENLGLVFRAFLRSAFPRLPESTGSAAPPGSEAQLPLAGTKKLVLSGRRFRRREIAQDQAALGIKTDIRLQLSPCPSPQWQPRGTSCSFELSLVFPVRSR